MEALLRGLNTTLYMANRLKVYMDYLQKLPISQARTNFETALIELYACILQFLARAICIYQKSGLARAFDAFWKPEEVADFEHECLKIGSRAEAEASVADRDLRDHEREEANQHREQLQRELKELKVLQEKEFEKLQEHLTELKALQEKGLEKLQEISMQESRINLPYAKTAAFDSHIDEHDARCHPATRIDLLRKIREWAQNLQGECIFWLNGMAGTGKSTISRTIAKSFSENGQLGASFFFKRGESERGNASRFFTTIALHLSHKVHGLAPHVRNAINAEPEIPEKSLKEQFEKLIFQPLSHVMRNCIQISTLVIVIDALDECEREEDIRIILRLLLQIQHLQSARIRIFLTSRPELPIRLEFKKMSADAHQDVVLQDITQDTIEQDISVYLTDELSKIKEEYNDIHSSDFCLPSGWPGDETIRTLTSMAVPLFIFAATVCRFVGDRKWDWNPDGRLSTVLEYQTISQASRLDRTYLPVLQTLMTGCTTDIERQKLAGEFRMIIGSIIVLTDPLSTSSLAKLLDISKKDIDSRLHYLHSVLNIPSDRDCPVRLLHLSFRDFLLDPEKQGKSEFWFSVDEKKAHETIATRCLILMSRRSCLRKNMCDLEFPGKLRHEIDEKTLQDCLPQDIRYACQYWVHHFKEGGGHIHDQDAAHLFLQKHFLHWLEALSLIGKISESIALIGTLQSLVAVDSSWRFTNTAY
jgi:hypothetical protein